MDWHDQQDLAKYRRRKRKQREYQQGYRERLKEAKTPERDDIAAELMRAYLHVIATDNKAAVEISRSLIAGLTAKGYNRQGSVERIRAMALRVRAKLQAQGQREAAE